MENANGSINLQSAVSGNDYTVKFSKAVRAVTFENFGSVTLKFFPALIQSVSRQFSRTICRTSTSRSINSAFGYRWGGLSAATGGMGGRGVGVGDRGCGVHGVNVAVDWNH